VVLALIYSLGVLIAAKLRIYFWLIYILALIFMILALLLIRKNLIFEIIILGLAFLMGIISLRNYQNLPACHISKIYYKNDTPYVIKGFIDNPPKFKGNRTIFTLKSESIQISENLSIKCCGNILVYLRGKQDLFYGEELALKGNIYRPFGKYLYNQGIFFIMNVKKADFIRLSKFKGFIFKRFAFRIKDKLEKIIFEHTSPLTAAILNAMVLGEKENIPWNIFNLMMKSGTVHILVVSGFNVGIVAFTVALFLKLIRLPRKIRIMVTIPILILYCLITGASTPVVRATIMAIVFLLAYIFKREPDIYNSLSIAAITILMANPRQLFDIGFQLSFVSVISLVFLYPKIKSFLHLESIKINSLRFLLEGCLVSFSCWVGTMGFIAYYFKIFSPVTILANIIIVPLATLITLCGFNLIFISFIFPFLISTFARTAELTTTILVMVNAWLLKLPLSYFYLS
jgi:competence protein ComEC